MADIARRAGVSVSTVSRALAGSTLVAADMRRRIARIAGDEGYVVNQVARGLRLQRSRQILIILPTIANPFFGEVVLGVEEEAQSRGYGVLVGNTSGSAERAEALGRNLQTGAVDGLILLMGRIPLSLSALAAKDRVVAISERVADLEVPTVSIDNAGAARDATAHLLSLGHRRIAHIAGRPGSNVAAQRIVGYRAALAAAGVAECNSTVIDGDFSVASGEAAMARLLDLPERPSAVFCAGDEMAIGAINAAYSRGLRVPADLSVVGFDDIPFAAVFNPRLTTIHQPRREMGRVAAGLLIDHIDDPQRPAPSRQLPHRLVIRASAAAIDPSAGERIFATMDLANKRAP